MAVIQPPITGDAAFDSWMLSLTQQINTGLIPGLTTEGARAVSGGGATGPRGEDGVSQATLMLFKAFSTEQSNLDTLELPEDGEYTFETGDFTSTDLNGWTRNPPNLSGEFIYFIVRYITADAQTTTESILNNEWSTPALFARPGRDAVTVFIQPYSDTARPGMTVDYTDPVTTLLETSPDFKNNADEVKALTVRMYLGGTEFTSAQYAAINSYGWTRNGSTFTPIQTQTADTGTDSRVLLINQDDVREGNFNEIFTCTVDY